MNLSYFSSIPSALFDNTGLPREANKAALADALWNFGKFTNPVQLDDIASENVHVLDGGSLLQKIPWEKGSTIENVCKQYYSYICKRYVNPTVVFDGYMDHSIKDVAHLRRMKGEVGTKVVFGYNTPLKMKKRYVSEK
jgi:hypothetical protein